MIPYDKSFWGFGNLLRLYGSAGPRALPFSFVAATVALLLHLLLPKAQDSRCPIAPDDRDDLDARDTVLTCYILKPYPFQAFAFVVGSLLVFRTHLSYGRYWEATSQLQVLASKLTDVVLMSVTFDRYGSAKHPEQWVKDWDEWEPDPPTNPRPTLDSHELFCDVLLHLVSLLHAVALMTLREDYEVQNIVVHNSRAKVPATNYMAADVEGGSVRDGNPAHAWNDAELGTAGRPEDPFAAGADSMQPENAGAARLSAGQLHFLDIFFLRADRQRTVDLHSLMPLPVIGQLSKSEVDRLGFLNTVSLDMSMNITMHGMYITESPEDVIYTPAPMERVHTVQAWLHELLIRRIAAGGLNVGTSSQARIQNDLSNAMLGYEQCRKLADTKLPFPWAQAVTWLLVTFVLCLPVVVVTFVRDITLATVITFLASQTYAMLNEVAREMEDPFHFDPNELPFPQMQYRLNERLLAVSRTARPPCGLEEEGGVLEAPFNVGGSVSDLLSVASQGDSPDYRFVGGSPHSSVGKLPKYGSTTVQQQVEEHHALWRKKRRPRGHTDGSVGLGGRQEIVPDVTADSLSPPQSRGSPGQRSKQGPRPQHPPGGQPSRPIPGPLQPPMGQPVLKERSGPPVRRGPVMMPQQPPRDLLLMPDIARQGRGQQWLRTQWDGSESGGEEPLSRQLRRPMGRTRARLVARAAMGLLEPAQADEEDRSSWDVSPFTPSGPSSTMSDDYAQRARAAATPPPPPRRPHSDSGSNGGPRQSAGDGSATLAPSHGSAAGSDAPIGLVEASQQVKTHSGRISHSGRIQHGWMPSGQHPSSAGPARATVQPTPLAVRAGLGDQRTRIHDLPARHSAQPGPPAHPRLPGPAATRRASQSPEPQRPVAALRARQREAQVPTPAMPGASQTGLQRESTAATVQTALLPMSSSTHSSQLALQASGHLGLTMRSGLAGAHQGGDMYKRYRLIPRPGSSLSSLKSQWNINGN